MKSLSLASIAVAVAALSAVAMPSITLAADSSVAFNAGVVTDYRYRGISQSRLKPALQGGLDFTAGAFYLGAWGSTIKWIKDGGGGASTEFDIYGGFKGEIAKGVAYDIGLLTYQYPSNGLNPSANTTEVYAAVTTGPVTAKYSHSTTNLFGFANSKGSSYVDLTATFDMGDGYSLTPHIGYQSVKGAGNGIYSYTDTALTLGKDLGNGLAASAAIIGTNAKKGSYISPAGKQLGKSGLVVGLKYSF